MRWPWQAKSLALRTHGELVPPTPTGRLREVSIGPAGEAVALWVDPPSQAQVRSGSPNPGGSGPKISGTVSITGTGGSHIVPFAGVSAAVTLAQPFPDGRALLVDEHCSWVPTGPDQNAAIFTSDGELERTGCLGDGIAQIRTTPDGTVWVGYQDTGIYGNHGWEDPGPRPVGASGLVRFTADLLPAWEFPGGGEAEDIRTIDECEALTLAGETV